MTVDAYEIFDQEGYSYEDAKGAKKRMDDWPEETSWRQPDHFTGILWYCDMNTVERFRDPSWTSDLDYSGLVVEIDKRIPVNVWKDKFPIVRILELAADELRQANPVSERHRHVVEQAPEDKDGICIVHLGFEKDLVVTWSATSADAFHMARCLSQFYRKQMIAVYGRFKDGWEWRPLEWNGDTYWDWERSLNGNKPLSDLTWYGSDAIAKVEELTELTAKIAIIPQAKTNLAEYNTIHDFVHQRLGAQLMQGLVNIGAVTTMWSRRTMASRR
ncbi:MAG: hypothetical protein OXG68_11555 [Chloroflexi bacterium]|nr:hypothetical protein [Chloroflexota bacterium]